MRRALALCALLLVICARGASAEWHFTPLAGLTMFGSTTLIDPEFATGERHLHVGGSVSWVSRGIFGIEALGAWTPGFFEGSPEFDDVPAIDFVDNSRTVSLMANVMVTLPQRWTEYGLRPFVSGGFGMLHAQARNELQNIFPVDITFTGFNIGGGAIGFFSKRTGVRFDVRYHGNLKRSSDDAPGFAEDAHLRYVTASVGLVLRR
jgi:hypothetical protein